MKWIWMSISMINTHFTQFTFPRQINILHCSNFTLGCTAFRASWGGCTLINPHWSRSPRAGRSWLEPVWMTSSAGVAVFPRLLEVSAVAEDLLPFGGGQQVHRRVGYVNPWPSVYSSWCPILNLIVGANGLVESAQGWNGPRPACDPGLLHIVDYIL